MIGFLFDQSYQKIGEPEIGQAIKEEATGGTGRRDPSMVGMAARDLAGPIRNPWRRKAAACAMAFVLALTAVSCVYWKAGSDEIETASVDSFSEQAIQQREEELAQKLYSAEAEEAKVV